METNNNGSELESVPEFKEDEVRAKIIEEFGFDEIDDAERIDKVLTKEKENHQALTTAIGQKIKIRTERDELKSKIPQPSTESKIAPEDIDKKLEEKLQQRDLDEMDYPDTIKTEIKRIATITGQTVKQAARDPYILATHIEPWKKEQAVNEATISRTNRSSGKKSYSLDNPPEVDMSTDDGRKEWDNYLKWARSQA